MRRIRVIAAAAVGLGLVLAGAPSQAASNATDSDKTFSNREQGTTDVRPGMVSPQIFGICNFNQNGDYVHVSSTPPATASGHGWWENVDCKAVTATVTVQLQIYKSGGWKNVGRPGVKSVRSGGGSAARATGRVTCTSTTSHRWRSIIDADLDGIDDASNTLTTGENTIPCGA